MKILKRIFPLAIYTYKYKHQTNTTSGLNSVYDTKQATPWRCNIHTHTFTD